MRLLFIAILFVTATPSWAQSKITYYAPELFSKETSGAVCGFSKDGSKIYFVREDTIKDKLFIYSAEQVKNKWSNEQLLSFSGEHNDMGGRLSPDGNSFYFTSDRPGGSAKEGDEWNIWVSHRDGETWSQAEPLREINDKGSECCPVPMANGHLMFSSDRGKDLQWAIFDWDGEQDTLVTNLSETIAWQWPSVFIPGENLLLFNSMKRPDTNGKDDIYISFLKNGEWTTPQNIGAPVNTEVYEDGAILSPDKKLLIFNQHTTGATPSQVMCVEWKPILKKLKSAANSIQR
ncbi:MAG: TolB family protein [Cyclobacteriaceae bacterium]